MMCCDGSSHLGPGPKTPVEAKAKVMELDRISILFCILFLFCRGLTTVQVLEFMGKLKWLLFLLKVIVIVLIIWSSQTCIASF